MTASSDGPERRQLTVMFTDLVGSTDLASALDPEDWHEVLNGYQHVVADIVTAHGGVIAQFQGDGAIAYFGYPEAQESASRDALSAGIAIVEAVVRLGRELPPELGISDLQARAGVHTGEVLVAAVTAGGQERLPDVWGQVPNMAARLQAAGEPGQIVVSGVTADLVAGFFELESLGPLTLKGIGHPVPAFRVVQRSAARHRLEARPLTAFIPRTEASAWLRQHWREVEGGAGRLALVLGEPGIGKSRFLLEFSSELAAQGHTVATIYCSRRGSLSPLQPFGEVMGAVPATPQEAAAWVHDEAGPGPLLLVVEDAHWADPSTLEAVHVIARGSARVLVVMSARPEIADDPHVEADAQLTLDRLSSDEARGLLEQLPDAAQLKPELREALVRRADGVPLFLEELARGLTDGSEVVGPAMPTTLSEVITARLDRVGEAKRVAQAAAVIGRSFDRPVLMAATGLEGEGLDAELRRLQEHAIIEPATRADEMQFRHALFHEVSYRSVLRPDRVRVHSAVGEMLVAFGPRRGTARDRGLPPRRGGQGGRGGAPVEAGGAHGAAERPVPGGRRPRAGGAGTGAATSRRGARAHGTEVAQPSRDVPDRRRPERTGGARGVAAGGGAGATAEPSRDPVAQLHGAGPLVAGRARSTRRSTGSWSRPETRPRHWVTSGLFS